MEMQFMARAAAHDLIVSKPWGDSSRYDFAVDNGDRFYRVQVKSTGHYKAGAYHCHVTCRAGGGYTPYLPRHVDFIAIYVMPEDTWYIIPVEVLCKQRTMVALSPRRPANRYFGYMEAWHLLRREPEGRQNPARPMSAGKVRKGSRVPQGRQKSPTRAHAKC